MDRNTAISEIKAALRRRSGKPWSVTGGRGTAYGWITIDAPPARRMAKCRLKVGAITTWPEDYEQYIDSTPGGSMTPDDRTELAKLLGLEAVHIQGVNVPASNQYYQEYLDRANGRTPSVIGQPYWES